MLAPPEVASLPMTRHPSRGDASVARTSVIWITDPLASQFWSSDVRPALVAGVPSAPAPTTYGAAPTAALPLNGMTEAIAETGSRRPPTDESEDARPGPPEPRADNGSDGGGQPRTQRGTCRRALVPGCGPVAQAIARGRTGALPVGGTASCPRSHGGSSKPPSEQTCQGRRDGALSGAPRPRCSH